MRSERAMNARSRIGRHIQRFSDMSVPELGLFLRAWVTLFGWWIRVRLGTIPGSATQQPNGIQLDSPQAADRADQALIRSCQLAVQRAENYHFLRSGCLLRSLTLQSLFRAHGIRSRLCLGVRPDPGQNIEAHAWLESGDMTFGRNVPGDTGSRGYERLDHHN